MITGGDLRQSRLDVGYKTFTISPWEDPAAEVIHFLRKIESKIGILPKRIRRFPNSDNKCDSHGLA